MSPSLKACFMSLHQKTPGLTSQKLALRLLVSIHSAESLPWEQVEISNSNTAHIFSNTKSGTLMFSFLKALRSVFSSLSPQLSELYTCLSEKCSSTRRV